MKRSKKKPKKKIHNLPKGLMDWRKKQRKKYIGMMAKNNELEVYFYVIKIINNIEKFIKVGVSIDIEQRYKSFPYEYEVMYKEPMKIDKAWELESLMIKMLYHKGLYYKPKKCFAGLTECFKTVSVLHIKEPMAKRCIFRQ